MNSSIFFEHGAHQDSEQGLHLLQGSRLNLKGSLVPLLSGEVQFFRMSPDVWEKCLQQVKNLGLPMVSTYLSWRRFSPAPGVFDLTGEQDERRNVPRFLELCRKMGLWVTMKPGPWICAEEVNGGYPSWLLSDEEMHVLDSNDNPVQGYQYPFQSPIPSYFHAGYLEHVRQWLQAVDEVIGDYCYPRGPIVLLQLDNEPCLTFHDRMFESDYHPVIAAEGGLYSRWLGTQYENLEALNASHEAVYPTFESATPPRSFSPGTSGNMTRYTDWVAFKEQLLARHVALIGDMHRQNGLDEVLFTINYNDHPQLAVPNHWSMLERASGIGGFDYYPEMPMDDEGFLTVVQSLNYSRTVNRVAWSPEMMCGIWNFDGQQHDAGHLSSRDFEYLYLTCLAYGLKGMNFYMLADRDNWVNSPLDENGDPMPSLKAVRRTVRLMETIPDFYEMEKVQPVGVLYYRPDARQAYVVHEQPEGREVDAASRPYENFKVAYRLLLEMNVDAAVVDLLAAPQKLKDYSLLVVPGGCQMDEETQRMLFDYVRSGGNLAFLSAVPNMNLKHVPFALFPQRTTGSSDTPVTALDMGSTVSGQCLLVDCEKTNADHFREVFRRCGYIPEVKTGNAALKTTLHRSGEHQVLYIINTLDHQAETELVFRDVQNCLLTELPHGAEDILVENGKCVVCLEGCSVRIFTIGRQHMISLKPGG